MTKLLVLAAAFLGLGTSLCCAQTCPRYGKIADEQLVDLTALLRNAKADEIKRVQAYETLSCSESQPIRTNAMKIGLQAGNPSVLRGRVLQDVLGSMTVYVLEIGPVSNPDPETKRFLEQNNGTVKLENKFFDVSKGCISLNSGAGCMQPFSLTIRGTRVELNDGGRYLVGQFDLDADGQLSGRVKYSRGALVPARIQLN